MSYERGDKKLRSKYSTSPLYDLDTNSFMPRYRLWMEYKQYCKKYNWTPVGIKEFGRIIHASQKAAAKEILENPEGVNFFKFRLKLVFLKTKKLKMISASNLFPFIKIESLTKKNGIYRIKHFKMELKNDMFIQIMEYFKQHPEKIFNYEQIDKKDVKNIDENDLFNDF